MINQFSILLAQWTIRAVRFVLIHPTLLACGYSDRTVSSRCATLKGTSLLYNIHGGRDQSYMVYYFVLWSLTRIGGLRFECTTIRQKTATMFIQWSTAGTLNLFVAILWYGFFKCNLLLNIHFLINGCVEVFRFFV